MTIGINTMSYETALLLHNNILDEDVRKNATDSINFLLSENTRLKYELENLKDTWNGLPNNRIPTSPGKLLLDHLESNEMDIGQFAQLSGISVFVLNGLVNHDETFTPEICERIAKALGTSVDMWVRAQCFYSLAKARLTYIK